MKKALKKYCSHNNWESTHCQYNIALNNIAQCDCSDIRENKQHSYSTPYFEAVYNNDFYNFISLFKTLMLFLLDGIVCQLYVLLFN